MPLLSRKGVLAVAAMIDVAFQMQGRPISAKTLASRHGLPPQHLESVLQALARGGYELARARRVRRRTFCTPPTGSKTPTNGRRLGNKVVVPTLASAEHEFGVALGRINLDDMARDTETLGVCAGSDPRR